MNEGANIHLSPVDGKKLCSFSQKICKQHRLNGFAFCIRHILEDKDAPFKQCQYTMKSTGEKCFNPVPQKAERIYCNNHLQVLGLIPVKPKTTATSKEKKLINSKKKINLAKKLSNAKKLNHKKNQLILLNKKMKNKTITKVTGGNEDSKSKDVRMWQKSEKKLYKLAQKRLSTWKQDMSKQKNSLYLSSRKNGSFCHEQYGIHVVRETKDEIDSNHEAYQNSLLLVPERVHHLDLHVDDPSVQEQKVLTKLKHQYSQLKQIIRSKQKENRLSYSIFSNLIKSAKQDIVQTSNILNAQKDSAFHNILRCRERKPAYQTSCCIAFKNSTCKNRAIPYTKFCRKHILEDSQQLIYFKSYQNQQASPAFTNGLTYSFMCAEPPKKKVKNDQNSTSKDDQRQKSSKTLKKQASKLNFDSSELNPSESESDSETDILTSEETFRVTQGTLSNFNVPNDEESFSRNVNYEDDDELMQNQFPFESTSISRDISASPTLNQLSSSGFDHSFKMFIPSPTKTSNSSVSSLSTSFFSSFERLDDRGKSTSVSATTKETSYSSLQTSPMQVQNSSASVSHHDQSNTSDLIAPRISNLFSSSSASMKKSFAEESLYSHGDLGSTTFDNIETEMEEIPLEKVNPDIYFSSAFQAPNKHMPTAE